MVIVSPVISFDTQAAIASDNSSVKKNTAKAIKITTDFILDLLNPYLVDFVNIVKLLSDRCEEDGIELYSDTIVEVLRDQVKKAEPEIVAFNYNGIYPTYVFFDTLYCYRVNDKFIYYNDKTYKKDKEYLKNHRDTLYKVHNKISRGNYDDSVDDHFVLFINFFICFRNKPFTTWLLQYNEDDKKLIVLK